MPPKPIYDETLPIRVSAVKDLDVIAAIDRGCTLTKIAFLPKNTSLDDADFVPLRCLTFLNANFEDALVTMRDQAQLPSSGKLHCTGVGCVSFKEKIKQMLGMDLFFVPEQLCMMRGAYLTLQNIKAGDVLFPTPTYKTWTYSSTYMKDAFFTSEAESNQSSLFPAGVTHIGSGSGVGLVDAAGRSKFVGLTPLAGKTFTGLARMLLGTTDYDEIMTLAAKGDRGRVDYQIRDLLEVEDSEYGQFPASMPLFPFGKASKNGWTEQDATREDMAASLVGFFAASIMIDMFNTSLLSGITRFYVSGNFTRAEIVRSLMLESRTGFDSNIDIRFMSTGHTSVICAMLSTEEDTLERWRVDNIET